MNRKALSLAYSELEDKPALASQAQAAGFEYIWNSGESLPLFGALAMKTTDAKLGSGVVNAFAHEPKALARDSADIQRLSGGRFILGLGGGTKRMNINQLGQAFEHPASRLRELIQLLKTVWTTPAGEPVVFNGEYYDYKGLGSLGARRGGGPSIPPPGLYLAAVNKAMFRLAGELCDGLCGHPIASVPFIKDVAWPSIDEGLERAGRTRADFTHQTWVITAISPDRSQALRELKFHAGRFMATRSYGIVLDSQGLEKVRMAIQDAFFNHPGDNERLIAAVPDDVAAAHGVYGTIDDVREQAKRYHDVVDIPCFYCASFSMDKARIKQNIGFMIEAFGQ